MKKQVAFILLQISIITQIAAQNWSENLTPEELAKEKTVLVENYPDRFSIETILAIHKLKPDVSRVDYLWKGAYFEAFINSGTKDLLLIETDELIATEICPDIIKARALSGQYADWQIDKVFKVETPTSGNLYRVDVYKNNKTSMEHLYFDDRGAFQRAPAK